MTLKDLLKNNEVREEWQAAKDIMLSLKDKESTGTLVVYKVLDTDFEKENDKYIINEYLDVVLLKPDEDASYSIEFLNWEEVLGLEICQLSIDEYGEQKVLDAILDEMFFFGTDYVQRSTEVNSAIDALNEAVEEYEANPDCAIPWEEVKAELEAELGPIEEPSEEDLAFEAKLISINNNSFDVFKCYCRGEYDGEE